MYSRFAQKVSSVGSIRGFHSSKQTQNFFGHSFDFTLPASKDSTAQVAQKFEKEANQVLESTKKALPFGNLAANMNASGETALKYSFLNMSPSAVKSRHNMYFGLYRKQILGASFAVGTLLLVNNVGRLYFGGGRRDGFSLV